MLKRCESCRGSKKLMGPGMMEVTCNGCSGKGFVPLPKAEETIQEQKKRKRRTKEEMEALRGE